jgi:hypothetical protein
MTVSSVLKKSFIEKPSFIYFIQADEKVKWGSLEAGEVSRRRYDRGGPRLPGEPVPSVPPSAKAEGTPLRYARLRANPVVASSNFSDISSKKSSPASSLANDQVIRNKGGRHILSLYSQE